MLGRVVDTNSSLIAATFSASGWNVVAVYTVGDDRKAIDEALRAAMAKADLTVTTGGLGPTRDDITKDVLLGIFGGRLTVDADVLANVDRVFKQRGIVMNDLTRTQAMVPDSCVVIQNTLGTAPIMWFDKGSRSLVAMPGVPFEMRGMLSEVVQYAMRHFHPAAHFRRAEMTVSGISESALAERLATFENALPEAAHLAYLPSPGRIVLRLDAADMEKTTFDSCVAELKQLLGPLCVGDGVLTPAQMLLYELRTRHLTLATAESCTGGNVAHAITTIAGCSDVYRGGVVSYANDVKMSVLDVPEEAIDRDGAVSEAVVRAMAEGVCRRCGADCGIATSGIAGPGGAVPGKPVGTVWIAATLSGRTQAALCHISGDRAAVIDGATARVLNLLRSMLQTV